MNCTEKECPSTAVVENGELRILKAHIDHQTDVQKFRALGLEYKVFTDIPVSSSLREFISAIYIKFQEANIPISLMSSEFKLRTQLQRRRAALNIHPRIKSYPDLDNIPAQWMDKLLYYNEVSATG